MTSENEKAFRLPGDAPSRQDKKRTLIGLYKQRPLETLDQFAERIVRQFQEHQRRTNTPKPSAGVWALLLRFSASQLLP